MRAAVARWTTAANTDAGAPKGSTWVYQFCQDRRPPGYASWSHLVASDLLFACRTRGAPPVLYAPPAWISAFTGFGGPAWTDIATPAEAIEHLDVVLAGRP